MPFLTEDFPDVKIRLSILAAYTPCSATFPLHSSHCKREILVQNLHLTRFKVHEGQKLVQVHCSIPNI